MPILLVLLVIIVDVGQFVYQRTVIIGAVSAGGQFAVLAAQKGTPIGTVSTEAISATQTQSQGLLTAVGATVNNGDSVLTDVCCLPASGATTWTCALAPTCSDGSPPGVYITIVGSAPFTPLLSADTQLVGSVMKSTLIERLK